MAEELKVIGNPELHDKQGFAIVTGKWDFSSDILPGKKLFGRILLCPHAHAKVKSIDASKAQDLPGVEAIVTHEDHPVWIDEKRYCGQEVAAVAATDPDIAEEALSLIDVVYEVLPFVVDPEEAMKPGAPLVGVWPDSNVKTTEVNRGDIEAGFADADIVFETTVGWSNYFQHHEIEPQSATVWWVDDDLYIQCSAQRSTTRADSQAKIHGMPRCKVHVVTHGTGCGFGDKGGAGDPVCTLAAVLSKKAGGKPVQMHYSKREHYLTAVHQHQAKLEIKFGVKSDGTLTAIDGTWYADDAANGATWAGGLPRGLRWTYKCPNHRSTHVEIATNTPWTGAYRCVADPPGTFLMGVALDEMAEELGMNPLEFRLKNMVTLDMVNQDSERPFASLGVRECLEKSAQAVGFSAKWHAPGTSTMADGRLHGVGLSAHIDSHGGMSRQVSAILHLKRDATVMLNVGTSRAGNGTNSAIAQIVCETLGLGYDDCHVLVGETDPCADGGNQGGSTRVITLGAAFQRASEDTRDQLFERAAGELGVSADELDIGDGKIFVKTDPSKSVTILDLVKSTSKGEIVGRGYAWPKELQVPVLDWPVGTPCEVRGQCASACEVAVDPETGEVEILSHANACDMGRAIFYQGSVNQIIGGTEHQINEALMWEQIIDKATGASLNANDIDQKFPTTLDMHTDRYQAIIVEPIDACGPYGAKGLGEPPVASFVCITNAIYNATGKWVKEAPIYPQKILKALGKI